jgi:hypothetical protein
MVSFGLWCRSVSIVEDGNETAQRVETQTHRLTISPSHRRGGAMGSDPQGLTPSTRGSDPSQGFGDGAEAGRAVDGFAVGGAAGFGVLVAKVDEAMTCKAERTVVQRRAESAEDLVRLLLARAADQTWIMTRCSVPSSVPVDQSRWVAWPKAT